MKENGQLIIKMGRDTNVFKMEAYSKEIILMASQKELVNINGRMANFMRANG